jgi:hypothetical protein
VTHAKRRPAAPPPSAEASSTGGPRVWLDPREPFLVPLLVLLLTRIGLWLAHPLANEDAYITFRYARNLAAGEGLVYNPGERVFGVSSPLWTLWSAPGVMLGDPVAWSRLWSVAADIVVLVLVTGLLRRHAGRMAASCFAGFFAAWPFFSAVTVSGMESSFMLALIVVGSVLAVRGSVWSGPAIAALALCRPEGPAAAIAVALAARPRDRWVALGLAALGVAALAAFFGTLVPQSVTAKAAIYGSPGPLGGRHWWEWLLPAMLGRVPAVTEGVHLYLLSVILAPAVVLGAPVVWQARGTALFPIVAAALAIWAGYAALGVAFFFWYLFVPLAGLAVLAACGLPRIVRGPAVPVSAALLIAGLWTVAMSLYLGRAQNEAIEFGAIADALARRGAPGETVFLEPIGLVGWRNPGLTVIDEVGLVSPEVARRRAAGPGWYADIVSRRRPDWIVVRREFLEGGAAFAGRWSPFLNRAERDSLVARYDVVPAGPPQAALRVLRRRD